MMSKYIFTVLLLNFIASCAIKDFDEMTDAELTEYHQSWYSGASESVRVSDTYMPTWEAEYNLADYDIDITCHDTLVAARLACMKLIGKPAVACNAYTRVPAVSEIHYVCGDEAGKLHELSHLTHEYKEGEF